MDQEGTKWLIPNSRSWRENRKQYITVTPNSRTAFSETSHFRIGFPHEGL